ncbi:TRAP transporter small permease [Actinomadura sp. WMMB 499]|uniref:TRAP transporter small permease n=1 Tax=Actinomadura sp. WMMB 499 TaxID=1219491 RepID=UPI00124477EB|nr:TRAP transporter small permease [Actinomadura sp. WMMB 499]QFG20840.1 TRAP transporter small permease [Actinomadura sp. WMMB 499]
MTADTAGPPPGRRPGRVLRALSLAEAVTGALLLALLAALMLLQAAQRYLPGGGWVWTGELARFAFVWLTFAMSGYLAARDGHIALKVVDIVAGPRLLRLIGAVANVTVAIVCLNLAYEAWVLVTAEGDQTSPALGIPMRLFYVIPLAGLILTAVRSSVAVFRPEPEMDEPDDTGEPDEPAVAAAEDGPGGPDDGEERPR